MQERLRFRFEPFVRLFGPLQVRLLLFDGAAGNSEPPNFSFGSFVIVNRTIDDFSTRLRREQLLRLGIQSFEQGPQIQQPGRLEQSAAYVPFSA